MSAEPLDWALAYAASGFAVLPIWWREPDPDAEGGWRCACGGKTGCRPAKHPIPSQSIKQATTDSDRIRMWWNEYPDANIAIATGKASGLILVDVDTANGKCGDVSITQACADKGGVPRTLTARSGSGGAHYFYRHRDTKFTRKIGFLKDVDYLADGGYVLVHPSLNFAGQYSWVTEGTEGDDPGEVVGRLRGAMAELPGWFDALEGSGRAGRKDRKPSGGGDAALRARMVNAASMEFNAADPKWVAEVKEALTHIDPDSRDNWLLIGIILGREFERNDDGWELYDEWSSRSGKYGDAGTPGAMRGFYFNDSKLPPQGGEPATIATLFKRAQDGGYAFPLGGLDSRPVVAYREGRAVETVDTLLRLLSREREAGCDLPRRIYAFGSTLGSVIEVHEVGSRYTQDGVPPNGWPLKVSEYSQMDLGSRITHTATIMQFGPTGNVRQVECPREVSSIMLGKCVKHFPRLNGIVQWPIVVGERIAGLDGDAYDAETGLLFSLPEGLDLSGVMGTLDEAQEAWRWLREVALEGFPFGSPVDEAAALAMLLTFLQRRAIESSPAFLITAPVQGSGKTALVKLASRLVHGRAAGAGPFSVNTEEARKAITSALLANPPCLLFDNLAEGSNFRSEEVAIAMTSGEWEDRRLGGNERLTLPNRAVWCFTGNNIGLSSDMRRRFVKVRMVPEEADHYQRVFARNLDAWAIEHRNEALRHLAAIALWGVRAGVHMLKKESGFKAWDAAVRGPVMALTGLDPFIRESSNQFDAPDDVEGEARSAIAEAWAVFAPDRIAASVGEVERLIEAGRKSSDPERRATAEAFYDAVMTLRQVPNEKALRGLDYGYAVRALQDRIMIVRGVKVVFLPAERTSAQKASLWTLLNRHQLQERIEAGEG